MHVSRLVPDTDRAPNATPLATLLIVLSPACVYILVLTTPKVRVPVSVAQASLTC